MPANLTTKDAKNAAKVQKRREIGALFEIRG